MTPNPRRGDDVVLPGHKPQPTPLGSAPRPGLCALDRHLGPFETVIHGFLGADWCRCRACGCTLTTATALRHRAAA